MTLAYGFGTPEEILTVIGVIILLATVKRIVNNGRKFGGGPKFG